MAVNEHLNTRAAFYFRYIDIFATMVKRRGIYLTEKEKNIIIDRLFELLRDLGVVVQEQR